MFNIGFGELVVILLIAFLVVGPKDLPKLARGLAKGIKSLKKMMGELNEAVIPVKEEACLQELSQSLSEVKTLVDENNPVKVVKKELSSLDPLADVKKDIQSVQKEIDSLKEGMK
ncbi:MAG: Sec-independent protein translocase protein TatB [Lachnospiraceae bacterium]